MKKSRILALWAGMFILCAGLGFIPEPQGGLRIGLSLVSGAFFLPPFWLLQQARQQGDVSAAALVRNLSALSLGLTVLLLVMNLMSVGFGETAGNILYYVLVIVSSPMICSGVWAMSLFLWACLLLTAGKLCRKKK